MIKEGARSSDPDLGWNSDWKWEVKKEFRDDTHGLVYPVYLDHEEIGGVMAMLQFYYTCRMGALGPLGRLQT